uniref:Integral membrane bound transporter domain-containing protein n=1 Tax=Burkholderia sp. (strain CCGE1003) TaxID=640512 RepID=E1TBT7_BURSG
MPNIALSVLVNTLRGIRNELTVATLGGRARQCMVATLATVATVYIAHWLRLDQIWWPVICAFSLTGLELKASLLQGVQQIAGTLCGAIIGWLLSAHVADQVGLFVLCVMFLSAGGLYLATSRAFSYMWILSTVLAIFMIASAHTRSVPNPQRMVLMLFAGAMVGTAAYWVVCSLADTLSRIIGHKPRAAVPAVAPSAAPSDAPGGTLGRLRHTAAAAVTLSVLAYLAWRYPLEGFAQAMTTALVTLLVPLDVSGAWSPYAVALRMCHRLLGCLAGTVLVLAALPLTAGNMHYCVIALFVLVWLACHFRFGDSNISYAGTQCGAVVILAFVHDGTWLSDNVQAAFSRLIGVAAGIVVLTMVLAVASRAFASWPLSGIVKTFVARRD